jgi:hypothetical protein
MENKNSAKRVDDHKGKAPQNKLENEGENESTRRSRQGMIDRATEPEWYGVTSF